MLEMTNKTHPGQRLMFACSGMIGVATNLMPRPSNLIYQPKNLMAYPST
jgi:hypothetical protein